jgi:hypothetical protein
VYLLDQPLPINTRSELLEVNGALDRLSEVRNEFNIDLSFGKYAGELLVVNGGEW